MSSPTTSKMLIDNLTALQKTREVYAANGSSKKVCRALNHNVRTIEDIKYIIGDSVYFQRASERQWRGPGKVLGQDEQQVLVKYGSSYVRVHPCWLALECSHDKTDKVSAILNLNDSIQEQPKKRNSRNFDEDSDEELNCQEEQNNDSEMNMLGNSMARLRCLNQ